MTVTDLERIFQANGVPESYYTFDDRNAGDCYVLEQEAGIWHTYYSERGNQFDDKEYSSEDEACKGMFALVARMMLSSQRKQISMQV